jgi:hypothetical protein
MLSPKTTPDPFLTRNPVARFRRMNRIAGVFWRVPREYIAEK